MYEAGFRAFGRFSDLYPSGSLSPTHPAVTEEILIYFVAYCFSFLQLKHSTIKTYLAGIRFAYIKACFQDPCCLSNGQPFLRLHTILKAVKKSQDVSVKPRLPITADISIKLWDCNELKSGFLGPYEDLVLETAFSLVFFGFLTCGEFTSRSNTFDPLIDLRMCDIEMQANDRLFTLQLKSSKTDPFRRGVSLTFFCDGADSLPIPVYVGSTADAWGNGCSAMRPIIYTGNRYAFDTYVYDHKIKDSPFTPRLQPTAVQRSLVQKWRCYLCWGGSYTRSHDQDIREMDIGLLHKGKVLYKSLREAQQLVCS